MGSVQRGFQCDERLVSPHLAAAERMLSLSAEVHQLGALEQDGEETVVRVAFLTDEAPATSVQHLRSYWQVLQANPHPGLSSLHALQGFLLSKYLRRHPLNDLERLRDQSAPHALLIHALSVAYAMPPEEVRARHDDLLKASESLAKELAEQYQIFLSFLDPMSTSLISRSMQRMEFSSGSLPLPVLAAMLEVGVARRLTTKTVLAEFKRIRAHRFAKAFTFVAQGALFKAVMLRDASLRKTFQALAELDTLVERRYERKLADDVETAVVDLMTLANVGAAEALDMFDGIHAALKRVYEQRGLDPGELSLQATVTVLNKKLLERDGSPAARIALLRFY